MAANMRHWAGKTQDELLASKMRRCAGELEHAANTREAEWIAQSSGADDSDISASFSL
ncbi:MAG TPA: hypothetical protein VH000_03525 [Rhizomicrobium sp.]|nr:hypothetical protein [Rhizomicrobium sp.]